MEHEDETNPIIASEEVITSCEIETSLNTDLPKPESVPVNPNTSQELSNVPGEVETTKLEIIIEEAIFKVPAPRTYGKQKSSKFSRSKVFTRVSIKPNVARKGLRPSNLPKKSEHKLKKKKLETSQTYLRPLTRTEAPLPVQRDGEQELISDPDVLFQAILSADIKACMKPLRLTRITRKPKKKYKKPASVQLNRMDPLSLYGITLHRYANNMSEIIRVVELAIESNLIPPADAAPPIPKKLKFKPRHTTNSLNFMPKQLTSFSLGVPTPLPEISSSVVREVLYQSIAAIVGLLGFEKTHQTVLDVLVDVLIEFFKKLTYRFKLAFEDEQRGWLSDFPNIAERVLVELGMGGCRGLHDYYQSRVVGYVSLLEEHCEGLNKHYKNLITCKSLPVEDTKFSGVAIKVEVEEEVVEIDTPQVQIAINDELELPSLDAGFQLLSSLEAGT